MSSLWIRVNLINWLRWEYFPASFKTNLDFEILINLKTLARINTSFRNEENLSKGIKCSVLLNVTSELATRDNEHSTDSGLGIITGKMLALIWAGWKLSDKNFGPVR